MIFLKKGNKGPKSAKLEKNRAKMNKNLENVGPFLALFEKCTHLGTITAPEKHYF